MARPQHPSRAYRWLTGLTTFALVVGAVMIPAASVMASGSTHVEPSNMVLVWNENAINVIGQSATPPVTTPPTPPGLGQGPPISPLHLAMVHGAIYDAVNAIDGRHEPYLKGLPHASHRASKAAAVAQAAHDVLVGLKPAVSQPVKDRVDAMLAVSLALITNDQSRADGIAIGAAAAAKMLEVRADDGRFGSQMWVPGDDRGEWRTVEPLSNNVFAWYAKVTPLTLKSPDQFRTRGPLDLRSFRYARDFYEVKRLGAQSGSSRTEAQTLLAGFVSANPVPYMNKGLRDVALARELSTSQQARLFVMTSFASADALIGCWDDKDHWSFWRPQTAIREADNDGNPWTKADPAWLSLFATPGYPEHPSGYNCYTAGLWHSARLFFGTDRMSFQLTSPGVPANPAAGNPVGVPGSTRSYQRFTDVIDDTIDGRILNGYHFRTGDEQGAWIGEQVAKWIDRHYFEPDHH